MKNMQTKEHGHSPISVNALNNNNNNNTNMNSTYNVNNMNDLRSAALHNHMTVDAAAGITIEQVVEAFGSDARFGLTEDQASIRLKQVGPNEIEDKDDETLLSKYLDQFKEPMILLLLGSAFVSLLVKQYDDAISIALAVLIVVTVAFIQEYRSDKALESLKELTNHKATVMRGGDWVQVNASDVVPGDLVKMETGDRIPADIRLIETVCFGVDESLFTGEVNPVFKTVQPTAVVSKDQQPSVMSSPSSSSSSSSSGGDNNNKSENPFPKATHVSDCKNIAFMASLVTGGYGKGIVIATGSETELGKISTLLKEMNESKTPLQESMETLSQQISILSFGIIAVIFLIGVLTGKPWLEMFTMGISLAVAAIPEGLPIVVTVTLAMGVMRMAQKKAIVRKLPSVESLGACNIICVDKTGTLTANQMTVKKIFTFSDRESFIDVTGLGYQYDEGAFFKYSRTFGCNSSRSKMEEIVARDCDHLKVLFLTGVICNNANLNKVNGERKVKLMGSPTEGALLTVASKAGLDREELVKVWEREEEIPFSSEHKWMAVRCRNKYNGKSQYFIKGATENIIERCSTYYKSQNESAVPLTKEDRINIHNAASEFANGALRVVALATSNEIEGNFTFVGLVGIYDPPREGVKEAISKLISAGVKVAMITGDSKETAVAIGRELGIVPNNLQTDDSEIALSVADFRDDNHDSFRQRVDKACIFYRMAPAHKMKIVEAYKSLNYVVAMTGDGINDAPSLKCASIGIAMGESGTDVSKEASEMILADDNFPTIMAAIEEGKSIFNNIKNFLRYQLTTSVSCMIIIIICTFFNLPLPLNPMQILWINIIMDGPPAQSLGVEPVDEDVMKQPPRDTKKAIISRRMIFSIVTSAIIMVIGTMYVFLREMSADGEVSNRDRTMTFTTFVMFQVFNALNCRSEKKSVFQVGFFSNKAFLFAVGGSMIGQFALIYWKLMEFIFETESLSFGDMAFIFAITSTVWIFDEILKLLLRMAERKNQETIHSKSM